MKIHMTFKHMDATESLKRQVTEKSERFKKFITDSVDCTWICFLEADVHVAEVRVHGLHIDYFAQAKTADLYQSIEDAVEKMEKQLRKHKEILKDHHHRDASRPPTGTSDSSGTSGV